MAAGAIPPRDAFLTFLGADFVLAGMFDFEIAKTCASPRKRWPTSTSVLACVTDAPDGRESLHPQVAGAVRRAAGLASAWALRMRAELVLSSADFQSAIIEVGRVSAN